MMRSKYPRFKFEKVGELFFPIPTLVIDKFGIAIVWLRWALVFLWSEER